MQFRVSPLHYLSLVVLLGPFLNAQGGRDVTVQSGYEITYATYLGGSEWDQAREVIPYPDGSVLIGAQTSSSDIPITAEAFQPKYAGDDPSLGHGGVYGGDCYLAKLDADGNKILAATYFGGSRQERNVYGMELDSEGNVVITSSTRSHDLPTSAGSFQTTNRGGAASCFAAKLSSDLSSLVWCTYLSGSGDESPRGGIALDSEDNVCIFGTTSSNDFPTTPAAYHRQLKGPRDAFVAKLRSNGSELLWSTLFGGSARDHMLGGRLDETGNIIFAGHTTSADLPGTSGAAQPKLGGMNDSYLVKLSRDGGKLFFVTYAGGSNNEFPEHRPYLYPDGSSLLPGVTNSKDFAISEGVFQSSLKGKNDSFLLKLSNNGERFIFSTLLGGLKTEVSLMPLVGTDGEIFIIGQTESRDFPVTGNAFQPRHGGGKSDGFFAVISSDASELLYCTYLGGSGEEMIRSIALGSHGTIHLVGHTHSEDFPVASGSAGRKYGGKGDAFVVKLTKISYQGTSS